MPNDEMLVSVYTKLSKEHPYQEIVPTRGNDYYFGGELNEREFQEMVNSYGLRVSATLEHPDRRSNKIQLKTVGGASTLPEDLGLLTLPESVTTMAETFVQITNIINQMRELLLATGETMPQSVILVLAGADLY